MRVPALILAITFAAILPAHALTITARVAGGNAPLYAGPHASTEVIGRIADGTEIPIDTCTQVDSDSRYGTFGDAGYPLSGRNAVQWCHIPDSGWVRRDAIVGRGLVNVTPPDFAGPGW